MDVLEHKHIVELYIVNSIVELFPEFYRQPLIMINYNNIIIVLVL